MPAFFAGQLLSVNFLAEIAGFFAFSFVASAVYIFNDMRDIESDKLHPRKSKRPLARGIISLNSAFFLLGLLLFAGFMSAFVLSQNFFLILLAYFLLNIAYSLKLKHISILDIAIVATGFLLRVFAGGVISGTPISKWLILLTFLLALFLALAKRRDDVLLLNLNGEKMRKAVDGYNLEFINTSMATMAAIIVVVYIQYSVSEEVVRRLGTEHVYLSAIFVVLGLLRYLQITLVEGKSGSPTQILLQDYFIQVVLLCWIAFFAVLLYGKHFIPA